MAVIYQAKHVESGKCYIGSTKNKFEARRRSHEKGLCAGIHHAWRFQVLWSAHGAEAFEWLIIEECNDADQFIREEWWLQNSEASLNTTKRARGGKSPTFGMRMQESWIGRDASPAHKAQALEHLAIGRAKNIESGVAVAAMRAARTGMKDDEDVKAKRAESIRTTMAAQRAAGIRRIWITDGSENTRILSTDPMPEGWHKGRHAPWAYEQEGPVSNDHREALSAAQLALNERRRASGKPHHNAGRKFFWATDGATSLRLPQGTPVPDGFQPGRMGTRINDLDGHLVAE